MRQVPETEHSYLIVGNGRLAKHLTRYLALLNIPFQHYTRQSSQPFSEFLLGVSRVLLLISDRAIEDFIKEHKTSANENCIWIHCSGLHSSKLAESAHPLASFSDVLFDLDFYQSIPFVTEKGRIPFSTLLPGLPNPHIAIDQSEKELYHAMCVLSGNFTTILWMEFEKYLSEKLNANKPVMLPYLKSISHNLEFSADPLTGPLKRKDHSTIERHYKSLEGSPLKDIYSSFVKFYATKNPTHENRN